MENPATWGEAEQIVDRAIRAHAENELNEFRAGLSLAREITGALREAGLLTEPPPEEPSAEEPWRNIANSDGTPSSLNTT